MPEFEAGRIGDIPADEGRMLRVGGHIVAVFHLRGGDVRATQPWCPHRRGPLADGLLGGGSLVCPLHGRTFDLTSGSALRGEVGVVTFDARVDPDGTIVVTLPDDGPLPATFDADATLATGDAGQAAAPVRDEA